MNLLLYVIYSLLLFAVLMMISCANPIHSVFFFILIFLCTSIIFIFLHADFIGLVFLMVYVGAIAVLFIFVVMMLNIRKLERDHTTYLMLSGIISTLFIVQLVYIAINAYTFAAPSNINFDDTIVYDSLSNVDEYTTKHLVQLIGIHIFSKYAVVLILSGITLLSALIGSVYLTNTKYGYSTRQQHNQLNRNSRLLNLHAF